LSAAGDSPEPEPLYYLGTRMVDIPFREDETRFTFFDRGWSPTLEDWQLAAEKLDRAYRLARSDRERMVRLCQAEGLIEVPDSRTGKGDYFEWLACFQVGRESYSEIARDAGIKHQAVSQAVKARAALIALIKGDDKEQLCAVLALYCV